MSAAAEPKRPRLWKYLLVAVILLAILIPAWAAFVVLVIEPQALTQEPSMAKQLMWFVAAPVLVVFGVVGGGWQSAMAQSKPSPEQIKPTQAATQAPAVAAGEQAKREYVLEVISLGVTLDKYRQGKLWEALGKGHPVASIREQDPKKYPWSADEKEGVEGLRSGDSLENGAKFTPMYWGVPTFAAVSPADDSKEPVSITNPTVGLPAAATSSGMAWNLFIAAGWQLSERPDRLLEKVFAFFDQYPDVPYVVLSGADGLYFRNLYRPKGTPPLIKDGNYIPEMPDSSALFVLARRERVEAVRPFAFEDADDEKMLPDELNKKGFARRLFLAYANLQETVPQPKGSAGRNPTVAEWLSATRTFTQREDIYPKGTSLLHPFHNGPSKDFKPKPWFPLPWNKSQLAVFDKLPTLGYLHRPVFVPMVNKEGKPLTRRDERTAALAAGWQQALQTLPEAERKAAPARVVEATGGNVDQVIALTSVFSAWAEQGGPEIDKGKPTQWINTDARLGNTGAATWFMQMAIGVMGSYREGGTSAAINLRDPNEASIVLITPPPEAKRRAQQHPAGGDVFRHYATPAIDPANYEQK